MKESRLSAMRKNLITLRQKKKLTQAQIAEQLSISVRQYQALEAGTSDGSVKVWERLKKLLQAKSIDYLLEQVDETATK
jgi:DNA-binding helix-turn-helix protein